MHRVSKVTARLALILVILAAAQVVTTVSPSAPSPYLSALSEMAAQAALAAPTCNDKTCAKEPGRGPRCLKAPGVNCLTQNGCSSSLCQ